MNKKEAIKATKNGAIAACISAIISIVFIVIAIRADVGGKLAIFNDPANFIDVVLILILAYGVYIKSRVASVLLIIYFIVSKVIIIEETQSFQGIGVSLIFLYYYSKAIQGSFVYYKLDSEENPDIKKSTKWKYILGIPFSFVLVIILVFAFMSTIGVLPSTRVQAGSEVSIKDISALQREGIIYTTDKVQFVYFQGLSSILESGNILTQDRVIYYEQDENNTIQVYEVFLNEITDVILESEEIIGDNVYKVKTNNSERWIKLFLSSEQKGDQKFVKALRNKTTD